MAPEVAKARLEAAWRDWRGLTFREQSLVLARLWGGLEAMLRMSEVCFTPEALQEAMVRAVEAETGLPVSRNAPGHEAPAVPLTRCRSPYPLMLPV
jgi:hypothetical protein